MTPTKECRTCGTVKPLDQFARDKTARDGRRVHCYLCIRVAARERYNAKMDARVAAQGMPRRHADWADRFMILMGEAESGCREWRGALNPKGYGQIGILGKPWPAHRVSYLLHYGDLPAGCFVCHHCDNRKCVRPDHLYAGDARTNNRDAAERDRWRWNIGEDVSGSKLLTGLVIRIRDDYATGRYRQRDLAEKYGISQSQVSNIVSRKHWRHVA